MEKFFPKYKKIINIYSETIIEVENLSKIYKGHKVVKSLSNVNFLIQIGEKYRNHWFEWSW
jgi:hypothetical protein